MRCSYKLLAKPTKILRTIKTNIQRLFPPTYRITGFQKGGYGICCPSNHAVLAMINSKIFSLRSLQHTITASPEHYIWRRCLPGAGAKGVQAVEGIIPAVARRGEGVTALRIPAINVATVSYTAFRTLNVISFLFQNKVKESQSSLQQTQSLPEQENLFPKILHIKLVRKDCGNQL